MLPLTDRPKVDAAIHTRHKAALGMSENSDAVVVVVSEETGTISMAIEGKLARGLSEEKLQERLTRLLQSAEKSWLEIAHIRNAQKVSRPANEVKCGFSSNVSRTFKEILWAFGPACDRTSR